VLREVQMKGASMNGPVENLVREGARLKAQISTAEAKLKEINARLAEIASFEPGSKTAHLVAAGYRVKIQRREYVSWDQEKLEQIRAHIGEQKFNGIFKIEYKPHGMKTINAALLDPEMGDALRWAMTVKDGAPSVSYEPLEE
jgi:hypothetical protein